MLVALPVCPSDLRAVGDLLSWISDFGGCPNHEALICADAGVGWKEAKMLTDFAGTVFGKVSLVTTARPIAGWPHGPKALFELCARTVKEPFLWLESDAIPLKAGWLNQIQIAYEAQGTPFMGCVMQNGLPGYPATYLSGIAVCPANTLQVIEPFLQCDRSWDISAASAIVPLASHTPLIKNFWGEPGLPPTFVKHKTPISPRNAFDLKWIGEDAVIFHRNKDGSLIRLIKRVAFPKQPEPITVVFPVCDADIKLALRHAQWLVKMGTKYTQQAVVSWDRSTNGQMVGDFKNLLGQVFKNVSQCVYPTPPQISWPNAPNHAFQHTARHMMTEGKPWLWFEADAVALKPNWLSAIQQEYDWSEKNFMGPVVEAMGHMNGGGVYPYNTPEIIPQAMTCTNLAWDYMMKPEMIGDCHNSKRLMQHLWGIVDNTPSEQTGPAPMGVTESQARSWILQTAVMIHRIKDSSLVNMLISDVYRP